MAVNPLNPTAPYSIGASNEASDNARQREEQKKSKEKSTFKDKNNNQNSSNTTSTETAQNQPLEKEALELTSQIIDSEKVIELLSHRPKYKISPKNLFLDRKKENQNSQNPDIKKINKAF